MRLQREVHRTISYNHKNIRLVYTSLMCDVYEETHYRFFVILFVYL